MSDDYLTPYQAEQEILTGKRTMQQHPYATHRTEKLLTAAQEAKIRTLLKMMNLEPDGVQVRELQLVVRLQPTPYGWRLATRKQADQMIGMMVNYARDMERERLTQRSHPATGRGNVSRREAVSDPAPSGT